MALYTFQENIETEVPILDGGILSRTLFNDETLKVVAFGFSAGQELSAHTAPMAAVVYFTKGEAELTLGRREEKRARWSPRPYAAADAPRHSGQDSRGDAPADDEASPNGEIIVDDFMTVAKPVSDQRPSDSPRPSRERCAVMRQHSPFQARLFLKGFS